MAVDELKFGDNDQLSALIAGKIGAGLLILLTDVDGLYDRPPGQPGARRIPVVYKDRDTDLAVGKETGSRFGLGGMPSKLRAVSLAGDAGILANICGGRTENIILRVLAGEPVGTWFEPREKKISARKRWIAAGKTPVNATIIVDRGAETAIQSGGKSLLPSGVVDVRGNFEEGRLDSCGGDRVGTDRPRTREVLVRRVKVGSKAGRALKSLRSWGTGRPTKSSIATTW